MMMLPSLLRRFVTDKDGHVVMWQKPNAPLVIWIVFTLLAHVFHPGLPRSLSQLIAHLAIVIWALLELFWGASYFRRTLGIIVLLLTAFSILR
jgi:hypothetical protein